MLGWDAPAPGGWWRNGAAWGCLCPGEEGLQRRSVGQHSPPRPGAAECGATTAKELRSDPPWGLFTPGCQQPLRAPEQAGSPRSPILSCSPSPREPWGLIPRAVKRGILSRAPVHGRSFVGSMRSQEAPRVPDQGQAVPVTLSCDFQLLPKPVPPCLYPGCCFPR